MDQFGKVIGGRNGLATIQVARPSECSGDCGKCGGCPTAEIIVEAKNPIGAAVGEYVQIDSDVSQFRKAVLWVYVIPLIALLLGIGAGTLVYQQFGLDKYQELIQIAVGFLFTGVSFVFVSHIDRKLRAEGKLRFEIVKIIGRG